MKKLLSGLLLLVVLVAVACSSGGGAQTPAPSSGGVSTTTPAPAPTQKSTSISGTLKEFNPRGGTIVVTLQDGTDLQLNVVPGQTKVTAGTGYADTSTLATLRGSKMDMQYNAETKLVTSIVVK